MAKLNINNLLKQYGLTQKDLAECTGINKNTISKYCNDSFENINKTHIDLLCKFFDCTPNDLFKIDETVEVKSPSVVLYDDQTDEFELYTKTLKECREYINRSRSKQIRPLIKNDCKYLSDYDSECIVDKNFKIDDDKENYSYNIDISSIKDQNELVKHILEQKIEKELLKQFNEKYNNYINDYIQKYLSIYLTSKLCDYKSNDKNENKDFNKEIFKKYKNFKINKSISTNTSSNNNTPSSPEDWKKTLLDFAGIENLDTKPKGIDDEIEPCIVKKKEYIKKD